MNFNSFIKTDEFLVNNTTSRKKQKKQKQTTQKSQNDHRCTNEIQTSSSVSQDLKPTSDTSDKTTLLDSIAHKIKTTVTARPRIW